ncbi:MAG: VCBS repeat-containing protein [Chitinophagaceae bacterium]
MIKRLTCYISVFFCTVVVLFTSCIRKHNNTLFTLLPSEESGIHFSNDIQDSDSSVSFINEFGYMGGGVGIGDFNNDGLKDIFFTGNQVSCRLYINKGNNKFEDITVAAGLSTSIWTTGVSVADVNNDGFDDLYVSSYGKDLAHRYSNLLFINQHDLTFKEMAADYGLADTGYSSQAVFFDYDKDGDLDMYLVNYMLNGPNANSIFPKDLSGYSPASDKMYRNDGDSSHVGHPFFTDVTRQSGIVDDGFGLGVVVSDFNNDSWPDIYVANDFISNDRLWLNNKNGTFTNIISNALGHQSYSSMGTDAADINNDGLPDITTLDMLPEYNERKKTSFMFMNDDRYNTERSMGYEPEFMRNMLQLNNGSFINDKPQMPFFSEIGQLAGIPATDWSWSVLTADFNNDGWKDLYITNGIGRDFINGDFLEFSSHIFHNDQPREKQEREIRKKLAGLNNVNLPNYLYLNNQDYTFTDASEKEGIGIPSMSNGAAYADLDNDGDLDLVINNINKKAFLFINNSIQKNIPADNHFLGFRLKGDSLNTKGIGTKIIIYQNNLLLMQEESPVRGYYSSVDQQLIFGLGENKWVDSFVVIWPDNKKQVIKNVPADTIIALSWYDAIVTTHHNIKKANPVFSEITNTAGILYSHHDNPFNDFSIQRLLPHKYSQSGPFITGGDINNDGLTDFFVGGGINFSGTFFIQQKNKTFISKNLTDSIKMEEDSDCILFDADDDGDLDLLVTCGDIQYEEKAVYYKPRLYINDGKGNFTIQSNAFPIAVNTIAGCVTIGDYDRDGDPDIFIGGRVTRKYPTAQRSYILQNDKGIFTDVTAKVCPALERPGMVTAAIWTDFDNDQQTDLIIAGEWMPIRFFKNDHARLREVTNVTGLTGINGMWRSLIAADIDDDGDMDLIAGNLGLNCIYNVSVKEPMQLFASDIDNNGSLDPILFYFIKDKDGGRRSYPGISRSQFAEQVPAIKKTFLHNKDYSKASYSTIFNHKPKKDVLKFYCDETRSCYFENVGNGKFVKHPLPAEAQFAPVNAIICEDFDNDGIKDLLLAGNEYQADVLTGRYDASYGCFLRGSSSKVFTPVSFEQSGFVLKGDVKDLSTIRLSNGERIVLAAVNNDSLRIFRINKN